MIMVIFAVSAILFIYLYLNKLPGSAARVRHYDNIIIANDYSDENINGMASSERAAVRNLLENTIIEVNNDEVITRTKNGQKEKDDIVDHLYKLKDKFYI